MYDYKYVIPYTTRKRRDDELDGKDYYFINQNDFQQKIYTGEIIEWDYCFGNYYGYKFDFPGRKTNITHRLSRMALRIKSKYPNHIKTVFLMPENKNLVINNLKQIYNGRMLQLRKELVNEEICHSALFDNIIVCTTNSVNMINRIDIKKLLQ